MLTLNSILNGLSEEQMDLVIRSDVRAGGGSSCGSHKSTKSYGSCKSRSYSCKSRSYSCR